MRLRLQRQPAWRAAVVVGLIITCLTASVATAEDAGVAAAASTPAPVQTTPSAGATQPQATAAAAPAATPATTAAAAAPQPTGTSTATEATPATTPAATTAATVPAPATTPAATTPAVATAAATPEAATAATPATSASTPAATPATAQPAAAATTTPAPTGTDAAPAVVPATPAVTTPAPAAAATTPAPVPAEAAVPAAATAATTPALVPAEAAVPAAAAAATTPAPVPAQAAVPAAAATATTPAPVPAEAAVPAAATAATPESTPAAGNPTKEVQVVTAAPKVNVTNGDDIDPEGECAQEIKALCKDVDVGEGRLAECVAAKDSETDSGAPDISDACSEAVRQFKIERSTNINKNIPLATACAADAAKFCNFTFDPTFQNGSVISCLRDVKPKLAAACAKEVFKVQLDASRDYRADPVLAEACKSDAAKLCGEVKPGGGRIQACLADKRPQLSWDCEEQLFRKEVEDADDIRLSVRLFHKCLADKKSLCADVPPGRAMALQCLEGQRAKLSTGCREEIDGMIERRVHDFRLDSRLRKSCENDIASTCAYLGDVDSIDMFDSNIINCLQDFAGEIRNDDCKAQVHKYQELAAQDIRFDVPLADACFEDRTRLCANVPPGDARVIRCLQGQRDKLGGVCRATLFDEEVRFSENIDFQYPMKEACSSEIDTFCKDVPHGNARVIRCLQDSKGKKGFSEGCKEEVLRYEQDASRDYRLNFRLNKACKSEAGRLCKDTCKGTEGEVCGGKVLRCLSDNKEEIKVEACKKEVFYYEKMEVSDFRNDVMLAEACREDVDKFCSSVPAGEGRVHACLREHVKELSEGCKREEARLEEKEADNVGLNAGLLRACKDERSLFCGDVSPGQARVFRCLAENIASADFGQACKTLVVNKLSRRQANWRLDPPLRKACRDDVANLCSAEDEESSDNGAVKKCLIAAQSQLSSSCARELGRSVHMAFFVWGPKGVVTAPCDADIQRLCLSKDGGMERTPGAVSACLADVVAQIEGAESVTAPARRLLGDAAKPAEPKPAEQKPAEQKRAEQKPAEQQPGPNPTDRPKMEARPDEKPKPVLPQVSDQCLALLSVSQPPQAKRDFDVSLSYALITAQLEKVEGATGVELLERDVKGGVTGVSLTGWAALAGLAALLAVVCGVVVGVWRHVRGPQGVGYTLVTKQVPRS